MKNTTEMRATEKGFMRKYPDLVDVERVYELPFIEVMNPTGSRDPGTARKHRMAFYTSFAGKDLYIGLPDKHVMTTEGWPWEMKACYVDKSSVTTRYGFSESIYCRDAVLYFVQYNRGSEPRFAYLRENQEEAVLVTPNLATHVMLIMYYRAKELKAGGSAKDWVQRRHAVSLYKAVTGETERDGREIFMDIMIFPLGGVAESWHDTRAKMMQGMCRKNERDQRYISAFYENRKAAKEAFLGLKDRIAKRGATARYYENSMDVVFSELLPDPRQEVCFNFRYTMTYYGGLVTLLGVSELWGNLLKIARSGRSHGVAGFGGDLNLEVPWWKEER